MTLCAFSMKTMQFAGASSLTDRAVCWLPRLDQLLALLNAVSPHTVLDCYKGDFACICFDEVSRRIADVVSETPELACLQAYSVYSCRDCGAGEPAAVAGIALRRCAYPPHPYDYEAQKLKRRP